MSKWEKTWAIIAFPLVVVLSIIEPIWNEIKRIHNRGNLYRDYADNWNTLKDLYTKDIWN